MFKQNPKQKPEYEYEDEDVNIILFNDDKLKNIDTNSNIYDFENFWNDYDKKVGDKKKLKKKFDNLKSDEKLKIKDHIQQYKLSQPEKQYRKNPETYLNNKSWNDEIIQRNGNSTQQPGITGDSNNRQNTFKTDAERREDSRNNLKNLSIAILQQS